MKQKNYQKKVQKFYKEFDLEEHARGRSNELPFVFKFLKGKKKILDLACGFGRLSVPLAKKGFEVCGVDIAKNLLQKAREKAKKERVKIEFKHGEFLKIPYKDKTFDAVIIIWSSFCHLLTKKVQVKALKEIKRVLKKQGIVIIDLPYYKRTTGIEIFEKKGKKIKLYRFNKTLLKELAKKSELKIKIITKIKKDRKRNWIILKRGKTKK